MTIKKVAFFTLGCKLNFSESSTLFREFTNRGYEKVEFNQKADIYVINTCSVTSMADKKSRNAIRNAIKHTEGAIIAVIGCYSQLQPQEIAKIEGVDIILGTKDKFKIFDYLSKIEKGKTLIQPCEINSVENFESAYSSDDRTRSFLKVQDGCDYKCAYCTIPLARGKSRNSSIQKIYEQALEIENAGFKEIVLTGVNIGDFGKSTNESFIQLLQKLENLEKIQRIRISSIEPNLLTDEIINLVNNSNKFLPHFHIPLQSGTNEILAKMHRRYKREIFAERIHKIKTLLPDAFIGVDIIIGFPGENDELFEQTYTFLQSLDITFLHIFPYSDRQNTESYEIKNKINPKTINLRVQSLQQLSDKKHKDFYLENIGKEYNVLFESTNSNGKIHGFTENYIKVETDFDYNLINQILKVKLIELNDNETMKIEIL
jgi:threonylcarbamoyladenosine tRNA methylthiotransferase MtaB